MSERTEPKLFTCRRHVGGLKLTPTFCAQSWHRARSAQGLERDRLAPCVGCRTGQRHAQATPAPKVMPRRAMWSIK